MTDAEVARAVGDAAGALLLKIQEEGADGDRGDREANRLILDMLRSMRPDDPVLSEESADDPIRLASRRVWIVDPLDGTREFAEGREDWAVHIALAIDGAPAVGAVYRKCDVHGPILAAFGELAGPVQGVSFMTIFEHTQNAIQS
ncbi:inositol monophosphatase family protein [Sphingomonas koreensis]|uniref:inositol monophosphatase family protein n=2 Tax=Sphingomonas koreensis TaxID=93064 RepID=UPI0019D041C7